MRALKIILIIIGSIIVFPFFFIFFTAIFSVFFDGDDSIPIVISSFIGFPVYIYGVVKLCRSIKKHEKGEHHHLWEDILERLQNNQPIDDIAEDYYQLENIPPIRTIQAISNVVKMFANSNEDIEKQIADAIVCNQIVDSNKPPNTYIESFNFLNSVYAMDDNAQLVKDENGSTGRKGTLVLHKGYLYFFAKPDCVFDNTYIDKISDKVGDIVPILGIAVSGYKLAKGLSQELSNEFDKKTIEMLKERFLDSGSFAINLSTLKDATARKAKWFENGDSYILLHVHDREEPLLIKSNSKIDKWAYQWQEILQLACIAENNLIPSTIDPVAAKA